MADHMLVLMVRGLFSSLQFGICSISLFGPFWRAYILGGCGAIRDAWFSCAANRRLSDPKAHPGDVYKVVNPYADSRYVYFILSPPYLIKTVLIPGMCTSYRTHLI